MMRRSLPLLVCQLSTVEHMLYSFLSFFLSFLVVTMNQSAQEM